MDAAENKKKLEKKIRILETAFSLFKQKSVGSTAIDDVVKATGIARGTFYLYFRDKTDLMEQLVVYKSGEYAKEIFRELFAEVDMESMDLRALAESRGGRMEVESTPSFRLRLFLPSSGDKG